VNDPPAMQGNKDPCRTSQARSSRSYRESATSTTQAQRDSSQSDQARSSRSRQEPAPPTTQAHTDSIQPTQSRSSRSHQAPASSLVQVYQDPIKSSRSLSIRNHPELAPSPTQINLDPARPSSPGSWPTLSRKNPFSDEAQAQDLPSKAQSISPSPIRPPSALMRQFRLFIPANNTPTRTVSSPVLFHHPPQQTLPHSPPSLPARLDQGSNAQARDPLLTRSIKPHLSTTSHPLQEQHTPTAEPRRRSLTQPHLDLSPRTLHRQAEATEDLPQPFPIQQCGRNRARTLGARPHADSQGVFKQFKTPQSTPARSRLERSPSGEANVETHGEEAMEATSARRMREEMMKEADAKARKKNVWVKRSF